MINQFEEPTNGKQHLNDNQILTVGINDILEVVLENDNLKSKM